MEVKRGGSPGPRGSDMRLTDARVHSPGRVKPGMTSVSPFLTRPSAASRPTHVPEGIIAQEGGSVGGTGVLGPPVWRGDGAWPRGPADNLTPYPVRITPSPGAVFSRGRHIRRTAVSFTCCKRDNGAGSTLGRHYHGPLSSSERGSTRCVWAANDSKSSSFCIRSPCCTLGRFPQNTPDTFPMLHNPRTTLASPSGHPAH